MPSLIRWTPNSWVSDDWDKFFLDKFLEGFSHQMAGFTPAVDMYETKDAVVVETPLPGIDPDGVELTVEKDVLTIQGKVERKSEVDEKDYYRKEVRSGAFYRSVSLPTHVTGEKTEASYSDGILRVIIPKSAAVRPKTIKIEKS